MNDDFRLVFPMGYHVDKDDGVKNYEFIKSLQIDTLVILIKESYLGFRNLSLEEYFTTDTNVLEYRLSVVEDLVNNKKVYDTFCKAVNVIRNIQDMS